MSSELNVYSKTPSKPPQQISQTEARSTKQRGRAWQTQKVASSDQEGASSSTQKTAKIRKKVSDTPKSASRHPKSKKWKEKNEGASSSATPKPLIEPTFIDMPVEVRALFYDKLPLQDLLRLREVKQQLNEEVTWHLLRQAKKEVKKKTNVEDETSLQETTQGKELEERDSKQLFKSYTFLTALKKIHFLEHMRAEVLPPNKPPENIMEAYQLFKSGKPPEPMPLLEKLIREKHFFDYPGMLAYFLDHSFSRKGYAVHYMKFRFLLDLFSVVKEKRLSPKLIKMIADSTLDVSTKIDLLGDHQRKGLLDAFSDFLMVHKTQMKRGSLEKIINKYDYLSFLVGLFHLKREYYIDLFKSIIEMGTHTKEKSSGYARYSKLLNQVLEKEWIPVNYAIALMRNETTNTKKAIYEALKALDEVRFYQLMSLAGREGDFIIDIEFVKNLKNSIKSQLEENKSNPDRKIKSTLKKLLKTVNDREKVMEKEIKLAKSNA